MAEHTENCNAWNQIHSPGMIQCGGCGLVTITIDPPTWCRGVATDGPCPLPKDSDDGLCWIHRLLEGGA